MDEINVQLILTNWADHIMANSWLFPSLLLSHCKTSQWLTVMNVMTSLKHQLRSIDRSIDRLRINSSIFLQCFQCFQCFPIFRGLCVFRIICYNHHHHHSFNQSEWNVVCKLYNKIIVSRRAEEKKV